MDKLTGFLAFSAGLFSFLSPCVLPLLPAFISHLTGSQFIGGRIREEKSVLMLHTACFIFGFSLVFVLLGASSTIIGQWFVQHRMLVRQASGLLIVVFGLQMAGLLHLRVRGWSVIGWTRRFARGFVTSLLTGMAFAAGWTPCVGLTLASVLFLAGTSETMWEGIGFLALYSLGMGTPFLVLALVLTYSFPVVTKVFRYSIKLVQINGYLMIGLGIIVFTGSWANVSAWLEHLF